MCVYGSGGASGGFERIRTNTCRPVDPPKHRKAEADGWTNVCSTRHLSLSLLFFNSLWSAADLKNAAQPPNPTADAHPPEENTLCNLNCSCGVQKLIVRKHGRVFLCGEILFLVARLGVLMAEARTLLLTSVASDVYFEFLSMKKWIINPLLHLQFLLLGS